MKGKILAGLIRHFEGEIARHVVNVEVMLNNPMGIHDHSDLTGAISAELASIAEYEDRLSVLKKYFSGE